MGGGVLLQQEMKSTLTSWWLCRMLLVNFYLCCTRCCSMSVIMPQRCVNCESSIPNDKMLWQQSKTGFLSVRIHLHQHHGNKLTVLFVNLFPAADQSSILFPWFSTRHHWLRRVGWMGFALCLTHSHSLIITTSSDLEAKWISSQHFLIVATPSVEFR